MGWANCGEDRDGRSVGYAVVAPCDDPACEKEIDRGLAYACGGMHGESEYSCEGYFCSDHMSFIFIECIAGTTGESVCAACQVSWEDDHAKGCKRCANALDEQLEADRTRHVI